MEILVKNGRIVDGTGNPWHVGNVGIDNGNIVHVGPKGGNAKKNIDARGLLVCPGFIDAHTHSDFVFLDNPLASFKLMQGVTTEVVGNCGFSAAPVPEKEESLKLYRDYISQITSSLSLDVDWKGMEGFFSRLGRNGSVTNIVALAGHGNLRIAAMGMDNRPPTPEELDVMKRLLEESMKAGAAGMSTGLMYPPGFYCHVSELIALAHVVSKYGGIVTSHIRNYAEGLEDSLREIIQVGREASVPIHISHITAAQEPNWGKMGKIIELVEEARADGVDVTMDRYPYRAANTTLRSILPPHMQAGGIEAMLGRLRDPETRKRCAEEMGDAYNFDTTIINGLSVHKELNGKTITEISRVWNKDPHETVFDLLLDEKGQPRNILFIHSEEDMIEAFKHSTVMIGSDSGFGGPDSHPRTYGTFPKILRKFVIDQRLLSLEEAVKRMTSFPAQRFGLQNRGLIREGMAADITIIDPDRIKDLSTYSDPCLQPEGVEYVILNGELVVEKGVFQERPAGRLLRAAGERL